MNILIVEDIPLEKQRIERMVREAAPDADIRAYTDSLEAQEALLNRSFRPDVAFLDIEMPAPKGTELAQLLKEKYGEVNIIFTTAYASYMQQAFDMFVSGYLLKPFTHQAVEEQLEHLRYPLRREENAFFARTAGEFEFFRNGRPVVFTLSRAKEVLAYLIDRRGAAVSKRKLFSVLFEDTEYSAAKQDHMKKITQALKASLEQAGGGDILLHRHNAYAVDMTKLTTDLNETDRDISAPYMEQYSWADRGSE